MKAGDHLVVIESLSHPLAEEEDALEQVNGVSVEFFLNDWLFRIFGVFGVFAIASRVGLFVRVYALLFPGLTPGLKGVILGTRHHNLSLILNAAA
jgi:hypothetical protein